MYFIYVLFSEKLVKRYIGSTENREKRLQQHNAGHSKFTSGGIPWRFFYEEKYESKTEAMKREKFLKSGIGRKWLDEKLSGSHQ